MKAVKRNYQATGGAAVPGEAPAEQREPEAEPKEDEEAPEPTSDCDDVAEEPGSPPPLVEEEEDDDDDVRMAIEADEDPVVPMPTLAEYQAKWAELFERHDRSVPGNFGRDNLVPTPLSALWQDAPHVPFDKLKSDEAQARLCVVRPISGPSHMHIEPLSRPPSQQVGLPCICAGLEQASAADAAPRYAHCTGDVVWRRRAPLQLASTLGFVLGRRSGKHMHLTPEETSAVHECLSWARPGVSLVRMYQQVVQQS